MSNIGKIVQVIGPVVDIKFEEGHLPKLNDAIEIDNHGARLVVEVAQHMGDDVVKCIAMDSTDGLSRGLKVETTGGPMAMPVGNQVRGRVMNVVGQCIDGLPQLSTEGALPIHRDPPKF